MLGASVRPRSGSCLVPFFFSLAFSGFARFGLGVLVLVFSLLLRSSRVPVRYSSSLQVQVHLIVTFMSPTLLRQGVCMCVRTTCIDEDAKLLATGGMGAVSLAMPTKLWDSAGRKCGRTFLYLVPLLGAFGSQLRRT